MSTFTPTQGCYLAFIVAYMDGFGESPAESEIAEALKVSEPSVNQMMKTVSAKELIRRQPGVPRSIELLIDRQDIPKWTGKRPSRVVMQWVRTHPPERSVKPVNSNNEPSTVFQFKVLLRGSRPPIWRTIQILDVSISKFHDAIQTAMGWTNSHLHAFQIDELSYVGGHLQLSNYLSSQVKRGI